MNIRSLYNILNSSVIVSNFAQRYEIQFVYEKNQKLFMLFYMFFPSLLSDYGGTNALFHYFLPF